MVNNKDRINLTLAFIRMAYMDYIAARVLLNKNCTLQGILLASTAIEKYFKAAIYFFNGKKLNIHLDKFEVIKSEIEKMGYGVLFEKIDPLFFDILSAGYKLRYYDNIKTPMSIGFFKNQFLGELDGAVAWFEKLFILSKEGDSQAVLSPLKQDLAAGNQDLIENNWVAMKLDKQKYMETDCIGWAVYIHPDHYFNEINVSSVEMTLPYVGSMILIKVRPDNETKTT